MCKTGRTGNILRMGITTHFVSNFLNKHIKRTICKHYCTISRKPPWKIMFFGTDDFSVFSLQALCKEYRIGRLLNKLDVVTTMKGKAKAVKVFSKKEKLQLHAWPPNICYGQFDVGLVVSFGHLIPEHIIEKFEFGMLNIHASLLPRWRGAAPIIYAIANGDTQTGVTIMKISPKKFDVGEIVLQESLPVQEDMKMGELYVKLGEMGAKNLIKTLASLPATLKKARPQPFEGITYAPKVNSTFACVQWDSMTSEQVYNRARALDGIFHLQTTWKGTPIKLINVVKDNFTKTDNARFNPGFIVYDKQMKVLKILCSDFKFVIVERVGVVGKKIITAKDFLNGYLKKEPSDCQYFK